MTEYERGAYTPYTDEDELEFDARAPRGQRRPMPVALITSAVVLVALAGAVVLAYRSGVRGPGEPPRAVGQPVLSVKTAGADTPVQGDSAANLDVYEAQDKGKAAAAQTAAAPAFAPDPEQPATRDLPSTGNTAASPDADWRGSAATTTTPTAKPVQAPAATTHSASNAETPAPAKAEPAPVKVARAETTAAPKTPKSEAGAETAKPAKHEAAAKPHPDTAHSKATVAETKPAAVSKAASTKAVPETTPHSAKTAAAESKAATKPAKSASETATAKSAHDSESDAATAKTADSKAAAADTKAASGHSSALVQIGAFASAELADKGWASVSSALPSAISGKSKRVQQVQKDGKTFFRTSVAGFASRADAVSFCEALKAKGHACFVKG